MIRRVLLISALLAGVVTWQAVHLQPPTLATLHEVTAGVTYGPDAFLGSTGPAATAVLHDSFGSGSRKFPKRPDLLDPARGYSQDSTAAASRAAGIARLRYAAPLALARAGRLACPATAPPPFPFV